MATFDISRVDFDPRKHYTTVRMQQGRVLTDDDWNENERIEEEERRRSRVDIIGSFGSPDNGFRIVNALLINGRIDFDIQAGSLHLGGLRLDLESNETYRLQKDWLQQPFNLAPAPVLSAGQERFDLVYLEVWQQAVSAVEDEALFEVALGGPDTTTRVRTMRRVHLFPGIGFRNCAAAWQRLRQQWQTDLLGTINEEYERIPDISLKVTYTNQGIADDLCTPNLSGGYLGAENQAIRVQFTDRDHITWGFDNASPLYRVTVSANGSTIHMLTEPKDQYHWPLSGQVVELLDWSAVLSNGEKVANTKGFMSIVAGSYNPDSGEFTLLTPLPMPPTIPIGFGAEWKQRADKSNLDDQTPPEYFYLRVWNRGSDVTSPTEIPFTPGTPIALGNTGLEVTITGNDRVATDYWVIAVRPETPNQVVPWELEMGLTRLGERRFFAPLAIIHWSLQGRTTMGKVIHDCRKTFRPLTDLDCCCTYTVGDGVHSQGDFNSIQEAIDNLPDSGGKICVLSGIHNANVFIENRKQIRITGCGDHTIIRPAPQDVYNPIFLITDSAQIQIDHLTLSTYTGLAIQLADRLSASQKIIISHNNIIAYIHAVHIVTPDDYGGDNEIRIVHNLISMIDKQGGKVAIFCQADDVLIERNKIVVVPSPRVQQTSFSRTTLSNLARTSITSAVGDVGIQSNKVFDPAADPQSFYSLDYPVQTETRNLLAYFNSSNFTQAVQWTGYLAMGGVQIGGTSERVRIIQNEIAGGRGNGITLGHLPDVGSNVTVRGISDFSYSSSALLIDKFGPGVSSSNIISRFNNVLYEITIQENNIQRMGLSGISAVAFLSSRNVGLMVRVEGFWIYGNTIQYCARQIPSVFPSAMLGEFAFGGIAFADAENGSIRENRIEGNGLSHIDPICGIFFLRGEKIEISGNRIVNNGPGTLTATETQRKGNRGAIVIKSSFKSMAFNSSPNLTAPSFDGIPTVKVHDNIVTQPLGHALFLVTLGPVSVIGNQFTSQGTDRQNPTSFLAGAVYIFNLGISKDFMQQILGPSSRNLPRMGPQTALQSSSNARIAQHLLSRQYLPSGRVMFTSNQTTLDMRSPYNNIGLSAQFLYSLDDITFDTNQSECAAFTLPNQLYNDVCILNTYLFGSSIRSNDNRFTEGSTLTQYSLFSFGFMNTAMGNQSTHCLHVLGNPQMTKQLNNTVLYSNNCNLVYQTLSTTLNVPSQQ